MTNRSERKIESLSLEDLTADLGDLRADTRNSVETWLEVEGYYPGASIYSAADLYARYVKWLAEHPEAGKQFNDKLWGKVMTARFRRTRASTGTKYYISREKDVEIGRSQSKVGSDPLGG